MEKGFSIIKLIILIIIIAVVIFVAVPALVEYSQKEKKEEIAKFNETINIACKIYVTARPGDTTTLIDADYLIQEGYLRGNIINPNTGKYVSDENALITIDKEGEITCTYNPGT